MAYTDDQLRAGIVRITHWNPDSTGTEQMLSWIKALIEGDATEPENS